MRKVPKYRTAAFAMASILLLLLVVACVPQAASTPVPTKAPATSTAAVAPTVQATAPASGSTATASKPTGKAIRICYLAPISGPVASLGWPQTVAVKMAQDDINNSGGINGSPVEVITKDSPFNAQQVVTLFRECADKEQAVQVLGAYSSGEFDQEAPLSTDLKIPVIGASTTKVGAAKGFPYAFRMSIPDDISHDAAVKAFRKANPNIKKVVIIGDVKEPVVEPVTKIWFPKFLKENGFDVIGTVEFTRGMTDFSAVVTKAKELNPEGIALDALPQEWAILATELKRQGVNVPVVTGVHPWPGNTVYAVRDAVEGWITAAFFNDDLPGADQQAWVKRFKATGEADSRIPKPLYAATEPQMYDAFMVSAKIMREAKVTGDTPIQQVRDAIRNGLEEMKDYKGITRTYTMDKELHDAAGTVYPVVRPAKEDESWERYIVHKYINCFLIVLQCFSHKMNWSKQ